MKFEKILWFQLIAYVATLILFRDLDEAIIAFIHSVFLLLILISTSIFLDEFGKKYDLGKNIKEVIMIFGPASCVLFANIYLYVSYFFSNAAKSFSHLIEVNMIFQFLFLILSIPILVGVFWKRIVVSNTDELFKLIKLLSNKSHQTLNKSIVKKILSLDWSDVDIYGVLYSYCPKITWKHFLEKLREEKLEFWIKPINRDLELTNRTKYLLDSFVSSFEIHFKMCDNQQKLIDEYAYFFNTLASPKSVDTSISPKFDEPERLMHNHIRFRLLRENLEGPYTYFIRKLAVSKNYGRTLRELIGFLNRHHTSDEEIKKIKHPIYMSIVNGDISDFLKAIQGIDVKKHVSSGFVKNFFDNYTLPIKQLGTLISFEKDDVIRDIRAFESIYDVFIDADFIDESHHIRFLREKLYDVYTYVAERVHKPNNGGYPPLHMVFLNEVKHHKIKKMLRIFNGKYGKDTMSFLFLLIRKG